MTALGDPTRRAIFERLVDGPRPVGELAAELPVSRPAVSQHLKVLKDAGLQQASIVGTVFWDQALAGFRDATERPEETA